MITYFTQVTLCWAVFFFLYSVWLRKETFFQANRWYLLSTLIAGLLLPLVSFEWTIANPADTTAPASNILETITVTAQTVETSFMTIVITPVEQSWSIQVILTAIYWTGVLFFAARFFYGIFQIIRLVWNAKIKRQNGYFIVKTKQVHLPFSFLDFLFWSDRVDFDPEDSNKILRHELSHIKGMHSIDVILVELLCVFLWCSPLIFLYKRAMKNIHEYLADQAVLSNTPTRKYGQLLLRQSQSGLQIAQANNFIHSQLKKRILMMTKTKSQPFAYFKYAAIIPLFVLLVFSISANNSNQPVANASIPQITTDTVPLTTADGDELFKVVEDMPRFPGCENKGDLERKECAKKALLNYIYKNIKYPKAAKDAGVEGTIVSKFIVEKDGSLSNFEIVRSIGSGCDEEVLRVVKSMPNFIPGKQRGKAVRVQYLLPVKFKLTDDSPSDLAINSYKKDHLIIVDNYKVEDIENINPDDIKTISVIKGDEAIRQYGDEGKNGVVFIETKAGNFVPADGQYFPSPTPPPAPPAPPAAPAPGDLTAPEPPTAPNPPSGPPVPPAPPAPEVSQKGTPAFFPGTSNKAESNKALLNFIYSNLKYPKEAAKAGIEGTVVVRFVITKEGDIADPVIIRTIGGGTDRAVLSVLEDMASLPEKWTPASENGVPYTSQFNLPVKFKLEEGKKANNSLALKRINIYPNPSSGLVNISLQLPSKETSSISITDTSGKQLYRKQFESENIDITELDINTGSDGIIFITIEQEGKVYTEELVLQKQ